jgi:hypothetical protein
MFRSIQRVSTLSLSLSKVGSARSIVHGSQKAPAELHAKWTELELEHPLKVEPESIKFVFKNMWTEPPAQDAEPLTLPFAVDRTDIGRALPVYTDYKGGGTKVVTMIRKIRGDVHSLKADMEKVCDNREVIIRPGKLVVVGNYHARLKLWLTALGF